MMDNGTLHFNYLVCIRQLRKIYNESGTKLHLVSDS